MQTAKKKSLGILLLIATMVLTIFTVLPKPMQAAAPDDIIILYTNDVHGNLVSSSVTPPTTDVTYAGVAGLKDQLQQTYDYVFLVDAGDAIQGSPYVSLTEGRAAIEIMNFVGYDAMVLGNHEFDFGMDRLVELRSLANFPMLSSNFRVIATNDVVPGFSEYEILVAGTKKVALVGVTTPESMTKASPIVFQNSSGTFIYNFSNADVAAAVQPVIDYVRNTEGADYVILLCHLGVDGQSSPWMVTEIIANLEGVDAVIDGHSHSTIANQTIKDKNDDDVVLTQTGTKLKYVGKMKIDVTTGEITTELVAGAAAPKSAAAQAEVDRIVGTLEPTLNTIVAKTAIKLTVSFEAKDPRPYALAAGTRAVRRVETNLGDLCADAYLDLFNRAYGGADIALVNGGGVRDNILPGNILLRDIIAVHPFNNSACLIQVTGQQILDALEFGTMYAPSGAESGGFPQIAGATYEVHTYLAHGITLDSTGAFASKTGAYRVQNVMIGGQPLVLTQTYKLAGHNFMLKEGGDGYKMFLGAPVLLDAVMVDNEVLSSYIIKTLGGNITATSPYAKPEGQNRIRFIMAIPGTHAFTAPSISGAPSLSLTVGYAPTVTEPFTIVGDPEPLVTQNTSHGDKIVYNSSEQRLEIAEGLAPGKYVVILTVRNYNNDTGTISSSNLTFTLTINNNPNTGDNSASPVLPMLTLMGISVIVIVTLKKRRYNN